MHTLNGQPHTHREEAAESTWTLHTGGLSAMLFTFCFFPVWMCATRWPSSDGKAEAS